jgi:hypothetical protein
MNQRLMDPADFRERLNDSFGPEPLHAPAADDVLRGRRRLRRRRFGTSLAALATVGVVGAAATVVPGVLSSDPVQGVAPAVGGAAAEELSRADVLKRCTTGENTLFIDGRRSLDEGRAVAMLGEAPRVMTRAAVANRTHATVLSEDGQYWGECQFRNAPDNGVKNTMSIYRTDVSFPRHVVDDRTAYEVPLANDPRLEGTATVSVPDLEVPCVSPLTDEERWAVDAECAEFTMTWNDRRPAEVAAVKVVTPDGKVSWADVREGYLSFAYTGDMTPEIAAQVKRGEAPGAKRVVFFDKEGEVLVDDRDPGHLPGPGDLSILNFPSLAWWLK